MNDEEREAALEALPPQVRQGLLSLAQARETTAETDLVQALDAGQTGLEKLYELSQPADLFAVINLAVAEHPGLVVEALFAAVVLHQGWGEGVPPEMEELRERWHWHVHDRIAAEREQDAEP